MSEIDDINDKDRSELKSYFVAYSIPTQTQYEDLIDAMIVQGEDPMATPAGSPLQIRTAGDDANRNEFLHLCDEFNDPDPWIVGQNLTSKNLEIATVAATHLSIGKEKGWLGINTEVPRGQLEVNINDNDPTIPPLMIGGETANYLSISSQEENGRVVIGGDIPGDYTAKAKLHITLDDQDAAVNPLIIEGQSDNEYFFINSSGQVGINTDIEAMDDPIEVKLRVDGDIRAGTSDNSIYLQNAGNDGAPTLFAIGVNNRLKIISSGDIALWASGDPANAINDSNTLFLKGQGKVGIGIETPETKLEVAGDIKAGGSSSRPIYLKNATNDGAPTLLSSATDKWLRVMAGKDIAFWANNTNEDSPGTPHLFIKSNGNIGIGTDSPTSKLEIVGDIKVGIDYFIHLKNTSEGDPVLFSPTEDKPLKVVAGQDIAFWAGNSNEDVSGTSHLSIKNDGKVGIGTDGPTASLEVAGGIIADSFIGHISASSISGAIDPARLFPAYTIIMWYGDGDGGQGSIPNGWAICDGNNETPDLQGLFVVGASTDSDSLNSGNSYTKGAEGGEPEHILTEEEMPRHTHSVTEDTHTHSYVGVSSDSGDGDDDSYVANSGSSANTGRPMHNGGQDSGTGITIDPTGNDQPHENRPPFMAIYFIMKLPEE